LTLPRLGFFLRPLTILGTNNNKRTDIHTIMNNAVPWNSQRSGLWIIVHPNEEWRSHQNNLQHRTHDQSNVTAFTMLGRDFTRLVRLLSLQRSEPNHSTRQEDQECRYWTESSPTETGEFPLSTGTVLEEEFLIRTSKIPVVTPRNQW
jgi:hypothetical protein